MAAGVGAQTVFKITFVYFGLIKSQFVSNEQSSYLG